MTGAHILGSSLTGSAAAAVPILFSKFNVSRQVFHASPLSFGVVNLKPLIPGHVLVCPRRVVPRMSDLRPEEVSDLFLTVQQVGKVLGKAFDAEALTISCQDGAAAGQSVPHVHVHLLPRNPTDFGGDNDRVYPALEKSEGELEGHLDIRERSRLQVPKDEDRQPRTDEEMEKEARWLSTFFDDVK